MSDLPATDIVGEGNWRRFTYHRCQTYLSQTLFVKETVVVLPTIDVRLSCQWVCRSAWGQITCRRACSWRQTDVVLLFTEFVPENKLRNSLSLIQLVHHEGKLAQSRLPQSLPFVKAYCCNWLPGIHIAESFSKTFEHYLPPEFLQRGKLMSTLTSKLI